jgi:hypothetical protein
MDVRAEPELRRLRARKEDGGVRRTGLREQILKRCAEKVFDVELLRDQPAELTHRRRFIDAALHIFSRLREISTERIHLTHEFATRFTEFSADSLEARDALVATTLFTAKFQCRGDARTHVFIGGAEIDPVENASAHGAQEHPVTRRIASNHNLDRRRDAAHLRCEWRDVFEGEAIAHYDEIDLRRDDLPEDRRETILVRTFHALHRKNMTEANSAHAVETDAKRARAI